MINQRTCPYCQTPTARGCAHLALAVEGRDFVQACIAKCQGDVLWRTLCDQCRREQQLAGAPSPAQDDFMWLETAFCDRFLKHLAWFGGMDYEWRSGPRPEQGGFWVLVWSKDPQRLWWQLRDTIERQSLTPVSTKETAPPWLIWLTPQ